MVRKQPKLEMYERTGHRVLRALGVVEIWHGHLYVGRYPDCMRNFYQYQHEPLVLAI